MKLYRVFGRDGERQVEILVLESDAAGALRSAQIYLRKIGRSDLIPTCIQMGLGVELPRSGVIDSNVRVTHEDVHGLRS